MVDFTMKNRETWGAKMSQASLRASKKWLNMVTGNLFESAI